ncbi:E3 ubiquitin-protein ligase RNF144A [Trifolium repens]|nr:E3 ubiquitin-protein ligase RNF144A [Trifolium repens]
MTKEESSSSIIICEICAEPKKTEEMFKNQRCHHSFCKGLLELQSCRSLLPKELIDTWYDSLCESLFVTVPKFYRPFKDCSAMLLDDMEEIFESKLPYRER